MATHLRYIITGAGGLLGRQLISGAPKSSDILGLYRTIPEDHAAANSAQVDLSDAEAARRILDEFKPDAIIHCAALSSPGDCEQNPSASYAVNVSATETLARYAAKKNIAFTFTSTDLVFDGKRGRYKETDVPAALSIYAQHKAKAEGDILKIYPSSLICRLPLLIGIRNGQLAGYAAFILRHLESGTSCPLFTDEYRSILSTPCAAKGLLQFTGRHHGILHLGGPERISRYEAGLKLMAAMDRNPDFLEAVLQSAGTLSPARPADVSLDSSLAYSMGFQPLSLDKAIAELIICSKN